MKTPIPLKRTAILGSLALLLFTGANMGFVLWYWWSRPRRIDITVYVDGTPRKMNKAWYANGNKWYEHEYLNGQRRGTHTDWNEQGQKICECHWLNGDKHGSCQSWYANGQIAVDSTYQKGSLIGKYAVWFDTGKKYYQVSFAEGLPHGTAEKWDSEGNLVLRRRYENGELVETYPPPSKEPFIYRGQLGSADFSFVWYESAGVPFNFRILKISATGVAEYSFYSLYYDKNEQQWLRENEHWLCKDQFSRNKFYKTARFQLSDGQQKKLRETIKKADVFGLKNEYGEDGVLDGESWEVRLRAGGKEKRIRCYNDFPVPLIQLSRFIHREILGRYEMEILCARENDDMDYNIDWL